MEERGRGRKRRRVERREGKSEEEANGGGRGGEGWWWWVVGGSEVFSKLEKWPSKILNSKNITKYTAKSTPNKTPLETSNYLQ